MYLENNNLNGTLPPELGSLKSIVALELDGNSFSGSIPEELGQLSQVETLHLQDNRLVGSLPATLSSFSNLTSLFFYGNALTGLIPTSVEQTMCKLVASPTMQCNGGDNNFTRAACKQAPCTAKLCNLCS